MNILSAIISVLVSGVFFFSSLNAGQPTREIRPIDAENLKMSLAVISDTHITTTAARKNMLNQGFKALSVDDIDAVIISGDMTNQGNYNQYQALYDCVKNLNGPQFIPAVGNHDTWANDQKKIDGSSAPVSLKYFTDFFESYSGRKLAAPYYSTDINGYKVICMSSMDDHTDAYIPPEEIDWLDSELADATAQGKPAFVICHWPVGGTNAQEKHWAGGGIGEQSDAVQAVLEKYENVFFITGHVHKGLDKDTYESKNGVNYINLPSYMYFDIINGCPLSGCGYIIEVYEGKVEFRARNIALQYWIPRYDISVEVK